MSKVTMPEPVAWITDESLRNLKAGKPNFKGVVPVHASRIGYGKMPLITTTQAEAYANARVRDALKKVMAATERFQDSEAAGVVRQIQDEIKMIMEDNQ